MPVTQSKAGNNGSSLWLFNSWPITEESLDILNKQKAVNIKQGFKSLVSWFFFCKVSFQSVQNHSLSELKINTCALFASYLTNGQSLSPISL